MHERWLSVGEIAAHLGVNPGTIYKWIDRKKMPAHKLGRLWKFLASEVDAWLKAGKAAGGSNPASTRTSMDESSRKDVVPDDFFRPAIASLTVQYERSKH